MSLSQYFIFFLNRKFCKFLRNLQYNNMPRVYISDPRGKQYRKRNESDLNAAAAEVKNGISLRKAAENHNVNYSTLQRWVKADGKRRKIGGQTVSAKKI